jgi:hypothetical protein
LPFAIANDFLPCVQGGFCSKKPCWRDSACFEHFHYIFCFFIANSLPHKRKNIGVIAEFIGKFCPQKLYLNLVIQLINFHT